MKKIISILVILILSPSVQAQSTGSISFQDLDNDGDFDLAVIKANFATSEDMVSVYDEDDDMVESQDYTTCCDFDSDVWVFDSKGDGTAELIVDFYQENEKLVARLYDDCDEDKKVSYSYSNNFEIKECEFPRVTVTTSEDFWIAGDKINYNINITVDGRILGHMGSKYNSSVRPDGIPEFEKYIIDIDNDFDPDYEFVNVKPDQKNQMGNFLNVDWDDKEKGIEGYMFWPYLGSGDHHWRRSSHEAPAPIRIDWNSVRITSITEIIGSRYNEGNYFIQSGVPILRGEVNLLSAENPFLYYDLADDSDGVPELIVRMVDDGTWAWLNHKAGYERDGLGSYNAIRYSWDQDNDAAINYNLELLGTNKFDTVVEYPGASIRHMPYDEATSWIFDQYWPWALFTADENDGYISSEGLYGTWTGSWSKYVIIEDWGKRTTSSIPEKILPNRVGMRSEIYTSEKNKTKLYFSPIDSRLHLLNAEQGMWIMSAKGKKYLDEFTKEEHTTANVTTFEKIEYENLNNDAYLDKWTYFVNDTPDKHLIYNNGFLIYSDKEKTKLMETQFAQSLLEIFPPRNNPEWRDLSNKLELHKSDLSYNDFEAMFSQFSGDIINIENGFLSDYNPTESGFRFFLECETECKIESFMEINYEEPLDKGKYLFLYDGSFFIKKLVNPDLIISPVDIEFSEEFPVDLRHISVKANIHYIGIADIGPVLVQFFDGDPLKGGILIGNQTISRLSSGKTGTASVEWMPAAGIHEIYVLVDPLNDITEENEADNIAFKTVEVSPVKISVLERLSVGSDKVMLISLSILLIGMLGLTLYVMKLIFE